MGGAEGRDYKRVQGKFGGVMDILLMVSWVHKYIKNYQVVHFTHVLFILCQLDLS